MKYLYNLDGSWPRRSGMSRARLDIPYGNSARERPASPRLPLESSQNSSQEETPKPKYSILLNIK